MTFIPPVSSIISRNSASIFYSATFNQPLSDKAGFIFAYNRQQSTIPFYNSVMDEWVKQTREAETYLLKGTYLADNGDVFSPYRDVRAA
ncbi:hypothetical protein OS31_16280 [Dickeya oryzae]